MASKKAATKVTPIRSDDEVIDDVPSIQSDEIEFDGEDDSPSEDPLAGLDVRPEQPVLPADGMAPVVPTDVMDAAHALVNAKKESDRAAILTRKAAEVLIHRMDKHGIRMVRVGDVTARLEAPETRLKLDGYKKPASEKPPKAKSAKKPKKAKK